MQCGLSNPLLKLFDDLTNNCAFNMTLVIHKSDSPRLEGQSDVYLLTFRDLTGVDMEGMCKHVGPDGNKLYGKTVEL